MNTRLLKDREIAERLNCARSTVWKMWSSGALTKVTLPGTTAARGIESEVVAILNGQAPAAKK